MNWILFHYVFSFLAFAFYFSLRKKGQTGDQGIGQGWIFLTIFSISAGVFLRFHGLNGFLEGQWTIDESSVNILAVNDLLHGEFPAYGGNLVLTVPVMSLAYKIAGPDVNVVRLGYLCLIALPGLVAVFFLGKALGGSRLGASVLAVTSMAAAPINFSKFALETTLPLLFFPLSVLTLISWWKKPSCWRAAIFGASWAIGYFSYGAFQVTWISLALSGLLLSVVRVTRGRTDFFPRWRDPAVFTLTASVVIFGIFYGVWWISPSIILGMGGGAPIGLDLSSLLGFIRMVGASSDNFKQMVHDLFVNADSWYLVQSGMPLLEPSILALTMLASFQLWRERKQELALLPFIVLAVSLAICSSTGIYYGARRLYTVLFIFYFYAGYGLLILSQLKLKSTFHYGLIGTVWFNVLFLSVYHFKNNKINITRAFPTGFSKDRIAPEDLLKALEHHNVLLSPMEVAERNETAFMKNYYRAIVQLEKKLNRSRPVNDLMFVGDPRLLARYQDFQFFAHEPVALGELLERNGLCIDDPEGFLRQTQPGNWQLHRIVEGTTCSDLAKKNTDSKISFENRLATEFFFHRLTCEGTCLVNGFPYLMTVYGRIDFHLEFPPSPVGKKRNLALRVVASNPELRDAEVQIDGVSIASLNEQRQFVGDKIMVEVPGLISKGEHKVSILPPVASKAGWEVFDAAVLPGVDK